MYRDHTDDIVRQDDCKRYPPWSTAAAAILSVMLVLLTIYQLRWRSYQAAARPAESDSIDLDESASDCVDVVATSPGSIKLGPSVDLRYGLTRTSTEIVQLQVTYQLLSSDGSIGYVILGGEELEVLMAFAVIIRAGNSVNDEPTRVRWDGGDLDDRDVNTISLDVPSSEPGDYIGLIVFAQRAKEHTPVDLSAVAVPVLLERGCVRACKRLVNSPANCYSEMDIEGSDRLQSITSDVSIDVQAAPTQRIIDAVPAPTRFGLRRVAWELTEERPSLEGFLIVDLPAKRELNSVVDAGALLLVGAAAGAILSWTLSRGFRESR